jgi:hypothetical protein
MPENEQQQNPAPVPESAGESAELMVVRCSICGEWLDAKPGKVGRISHGLCPACHAMEMKRFELYLDEQREKGTPT